MCRLASSKAEDTYMGHEQEPRARKREIKRGTCAYLQDRESFHPFVLCPLLSYFPLKKAHQQSRFSLFFICSLFSSSLFIFSLPPFCLLFHVPFIDFMKRWHSVAAIARFHLRQPRPLQKKQHLFKWVSLFSMKLCTT